MKLIAIFVLMICSFTLAYAQEADDFDLHDFQLRIYKADTIKQMLVYRYEITQKGKRVDSALMYRSIFTYGDNGSAVEHQEIITNNSSLSFTYTCRYNKNNDIIKRSIILDKPQKGGINYEYEYDDSGRQIAETQFNIDTSSVSKIRKIYNNKGEMVKTMIENENYDTPFNLRVFRLKDSLFYFEGRLNTMVHYDYFGKVSSTYFYEYEGTDDETVTVTEQANNTQHLISKSKYNKYGQITQSMSSPFSNPFMQHIERQTIGKLFYNPDGTINTYINYDNGKVAYMLKYYYTKL